MMEMWHITGEDSSIPTDVAVKDLFPSPHMVLPTAGRISSIVGTTWERGVGSDPRGVMMHKGGDLKVA